MRARKYFTVKQWQKFKTNDYFDMQEVGNELEYDSCYGQKCLIEYGIQLDIVITFY